MTTTTTTSARETPLPTTMKAAIATGFGSIDANIFVKDDWPVPRLEDAPSSSQKSNNNNSGWMIVKVLACALAPGDVRVLSGLTDYFQLPKSGHPYIPGSDITGIVAQVQEGEPKFKVGDTVVCRFDEPQPNGGLAEYRLVKTELSEHAPQTVPPIVSCGLPASAAAAKRIVKLYMKPGDRVLILGGSGSVGSCVCQYAKLNGASFIAATSTQAELVLSLGADQVIDYRATNWWEVPEFQENKFDVVFDMVNGKNWTVGGRSGKAIKRKGYYVALMTGVETDMEVHGMWDTIKVVFSLVGRLLWTRINPFSPIWAAPEALKLEPGDLQQLFEDVDHGRLKMILDPKSPFEFTEKGVREAFALQKSIHAHGKVVVKISDD